MKRKITYIIADIDKALAFEWIAEKLDKSRFDLTFILILQKPAFLGSYLADLGIAVNSVYYHNKLGFSKAFFKVLQLLIRRKPDVVHCHLLKASLLGLVAAKIAGIRKRIYTRHHSDYHQRYFPKGQKWDKICNYLATDIIAPSNVVREVLVKREGVPDHKVHVIYHGFDLSYFETPEVERIDNLRKKYKISDSDYPVIGVISRFTELKGIQYIIPAFKQLLAQYPTAVLMLFNAQGEYKPSLEKLLNSLPTKSYRVIPFENDLAAVYKLFTIFVQASTERTIEAFGQTYVEALAAGVPSVFTKSGIASDFVQDSKNAFVVPFKSSDAIFEKFDIIMRDYSRAMELALQGRQEVKKIFSLPEMICSLEHLYE